jgi:Zn finger protein HypA/HybF involved in hydrogenase expression
MKIEIYCYSCKKESEVQVGETYHVSCPNCRSENICDVEDKED